MSCYHGSVPQEVRPGTARVLVTELSGSGHINPTPAMKPCEDSETEVELHLSPEKLKSMCGTPDLSQVTSLEVCVDTQEITLGNFGAYLPKLVQLRMNNSMIMSVRDLGTTLSHLQVLWMSRCCLQDLDGISTLSSLKELYLAYNGVSDLSQVGMLENLQLLDLEGNDVDDLVQVQYLGLCNKLQTLTLGGNPVCMRPNPTATQMTDYSYRAAVRELVPQLRYLDDVRVEDDGLVCSTNMGEDWAILRNSIRDCNSSQAATEEGAGKILFCGNPVKGIRARREKLRTAPTRSTFTPCDLPIHVPEHTYDLEEPNVKERSDLFAELRAWREQHSRRLQEIKRERLPQVLAIQHNDEEEEENEEDDYEEEGFGGMRNDSSDEENSEEKHNDKLDTASPDSSFRSFSPDLLNREASSPDVSRLSLSPDTTLSPSPPLSATAASSHRKLPGIRARRLRLSQACSERLPHSSSVGRPPGTYTSTADTDLNFKSIQQVTRTKVPLLPSPAHIPRPPATMEGGGHMDSCVEMDVLSVKNGNKHQMPKLLDRPAVVDQVAGEHDTHRDSDRVVSLFLFSLFSFFIKQAVTETIRLQQLTWWALTRVVVCGLAPFLSRGILSSARTRGLC
eukprot:superscaffoldBa00002676_g14969